MILESCSALDSNCLPPGGLRIFVTPSQQRAAEVAFGVSDLRAYFAMNGVELVTGFPIVLKHEIRREEPPKPSGDRTWLHKRKGR